MSNLSPVKITHRNEQLICTTMIAMSQEGTIRWKKFSIACDNAKELWDTIHAIHARGAQALAEQSSGVNFGLASSNVIEVDFNYVEAKVREFLGKGNKIRTLAAGDSAFSTSKLDINSLLAELDNIPDKINEELNAGQESPIEPIDEAFDEVRVA